MATYQAEIKTLETGSSYTVTVYSGALSTAKQEIQRLYDPIYIRNLRQVSERSSSSDDSDGSGSFYLLLGFVALGVVVTYWPVFVGIGALFLIYKLVTHFSS